MKNRFLNQRLLVNTWKTCLLTFLTWISLEQATPNATGFTTTSITAGVPEKTSFRLTTRLSAIGPESDKVIEITSTPETVVVIESLKDSPARKKKKKSGQIVSLSGIAGLPFPEEKRESELYGGGYLVQDDDDSFKRPPYYPIQNKGDFTLTLLPVFRIPSDWRSYLPGNHWFHWVMGEPDPVSGVTLHIRFNGSSPSVMQLSQAEFRQLKAYMGSTKQLLQWLVPKLSGREAFVHCLMDMAAGLSEQDEDSRQQIEKQIDTLAEWPDHEFNLEFEWEQLEQTLANSDNFMDMTMAHEPDTETIYEGEDIKKLIYQAMFSWLRGSKKNRSNSSGSGNRAGSSQGGAERSGVGGNAQDDEESERWLLTRMQEMSLEYTPSLRIVFAGMQNVGKSSLGNQLIGWEPFKRNAVYNEETDPVYRFQEVEIKSIKGYGGFGYGSDYIKHQYLEDENIKQNDVIIFLFDKDLTEHDGEAIKVLVENGNRIIFVCNKVDTCTHKGDKEKIKDRLERNLRKVGIQNTPNLIFTCSQSNSKNVEEITATKELEKEILTILKKNERTFFEKYLKTRMRPDEKLIKFLKEKTEGVVKTYDDQLPSIEVINIIISDAIKEIINPDVRTDKVHGSELDIFKGYFHKILGHLENITSDNDQKFFLRTCNSIARDVFPEEEVAALTTDSGVTIGRSFGQWGAVVGALFGRLVGVGVAKVANAFIKRNFNIGLDSYHLCKNEIKDILDQKMNVEISIVYLKTPTGMLDFNSHDFDKFLEIEIEIEKIKKKYKDKLAKFELWAEELQEKMRNATILFRELIEKWLQYYQRVYDQTHFAAASVAFPVPYDEISNTVIKPKIQQKQITQNPPLTPAKRPHIL
ncbi:MULTISPECIES: GTPase domain-containing protein [unclassified Endozoicomonas]|uniref:GTPase domain-containing protein n=1 Tax=unclassified Endozoicomonas TaxID=2644528 RepID=UPI003BB560DF